MKLKYDNIKIKTSEDFESYEYGIKTKDMGVILEILRSRMYKNPIASICREISSNSRDANREAGNYSPIHIRFEDNEMFESNACVVFQDEGVGISPKRMADVFVNYGSSTKRNTNELTGGFGLGAKTPFSYTDVYSIITRFDGIEYTYMTAIENGKEGKMFISSKQETKEKNGTQIIVPIEKDDRQKFEKEIYRATSFWDVKPIYENFQYKHDVTEEYSYKECKIFSSNDTGYYNNILTSGVYLLIDGIVYDIDRNMINTQNIHDYDKNVIVLLGFKTGELNISANRESVTYDKKTIKKINEVYTDLKEHMLQKINDVISGQKDYFHACLMSNDIMKNNGKESGIPYFRNVVGLERKDLVYKEKKIDCNIHSRALRISLIGEDKRKAKSAHVINQDFLDYPIYLLDQPKTLISQNRTIKDNNEYHILIELVDTNILKFSDMTFTEKRQCARRVRETKMWIDKLYEWGVPIKLYSKVERTKIKRDMSGVKRVKKNHVTVKTRIIRELQRSNGRKAELKIDPLYIYKGNDILDESKCCYMSVHSINKDYWTQEETTKFNVCKDINVIIISNRFEKHLKDRIQHIDEYVEEKKEEMYQKAVNASVVNDISSDCEELYELSFSNPEINNAFKYVEEVRKDRFDCYSSEVLDNYKPDKKILDAVKTINGILEKYPMLKTYDSYSYRCKKTEWNDYIAMVDLMEETKKETETEELQVA